MTTNEKLNHIYQLYSEKKFAEAFVIVEEILAIEPNNIYAKRYESLLRPYLNDKSVVGKIPTVKGKNLACPHCQSAIALSALSLEQREKIRKNEYENLAIKCPYCHIIFTMQKKSAESMFGIKIGDKAFYKEKDYRVVGSVLYKGHWYEGYYSGALEYLEWILLGTDNSYLYFSEGYFMDEGEYNEIFEMAEKIIPDFEITDVNDKAILINGRWRDFSEKNIIQASALHGENSKVFTVGEDVILLEFSYNWRDFILEKESAGRQSEAGIYESVTVNEFSVEKMFGKSKIRQMNNGLSSSDNEFLKMASKIDNQAKNFFPALILFFLSIMVLPISLIISEKLFQTNTITKIEDIEAGDKFRIPFSANLKWPETLISTTRYDYGGVKYTYSQLEWLNFSVKTDADREILKKIYNWQASAKVQEIFSLPIYREK